MPVRPTYPGVYIEEKPSGVRTITGVPTSVAAFVGYTSRGRDNLAVRILSWADYEREFGGLASDSELSYAVRQFYANGGSTAWVVRVPRTNAVAASITAQDKVGAGAKSALRLDARSSGTAANGLLVDVYYDGVSSPNYYLTVTDRNTGALERFLVSQDSAANNYVLAVVNDPARGSKLVRASVPDNAAARPAQTGTIGGAIPRNADLSLNIGVPLTLKVSSTKPAGVFADFAVPVFGATDVVPGSVLGVARVLERKMNEALGAVLRGASVRCEPSHTGDGLRVWAAFDQQLLPGTDDAVLSFKDSGNLRLNAAGVTANVGCYVIGTGVTEAAQTNAIAGTNGTGLPTVAALTGSRGVNPPTGMFALEKVDLFNILCIPDVTRATPADPSIPEIGATERGVLLGDAMSYCKERRAFMLVDAPPDVDDVDAAANWIGDELSPIRDSYGAAYFPRLRLPDPLDGYRLRAFAPCGVIAGLYSRIDSSSGVWKAPAGTEATLDDVRDVVYKLSDAENGVLNPLGLNCLRSFPTWGNVCWGARTLVGADDLADEWKYVPVRRLALFIEESLYIGTKWAVFEPNDEPLWAQLRLNVGSFMNTLFRQGAFAGKAAKDAYLVKCDAETTTQADRDRGIVNILVMFAPLKPAEFVVITIQQMAGQLQV